MFKVDSQYTKWDIYDILNVPVERQRGAWDKGLHKYENQFFIFANVGIPGRTEHNYDNYWDGDLFFWQAANHTNIIQPQVKELLEGNLPVYIFTRTDNKDPFTYEGQGSIVRYEDTTPVRIVWEFTKDDEIRNEKLPEEISPSSELTEGASQRIPVNKYERNPAARRLCISHFGLNCAVCNFNFEKIFGEMGKNFIHVHHLFLLSEIKKEYVIDPKTDLIPVCPNCHAMLHKRNPPFTIQELKNEINKIKDSE